MNDDTIGVFGIVIGFILGLIIVGAAASSKINRQESNYKALQDEAIKRNYATLVVDENREVQFQWIEPETNKGN